MSRYQNWAIRDFSGGQVSRADDNLIPDNAASLCENVISRYVGSLQSRPGQSRLNTDELAAAVQGLHAYYYGTTPTRRIVAAANGVAYYWDGSAFQSLKTGLSATNPIMFETTVNYMVGMDGANAPWKWDGSVVSALENAPAKGRYPKLHYEKLFCVDADDPSVLIWSDSFQPESWTAINYQTVKDGDGDEITCLFPYIGEMLIGKRRSTHTLQGSSLDDFRLKELDARVGIVGPRAAAQHGLYVYTVSDEGMMRFNGMKYTNLSEMKDPVFWARVNKQYLHKAAVKSWGDLVLFALPVDSGTYNNYVVAFYPEGPDGGSFWPWSEIDASCFIDYDDGTSLKLYSGDANAGYVNRQDTGHSDFDGNIVAYWEGKAFDKGSPEYLAKAKKAFLSKYPSAVANPALTLSLDYGSFGNLELKRQNDEAVEYRFTATVNKWRYIQPKLTYTGKTGFNVRDIMIPYRPARKPKVKAGVEE